MTLRDRLIEAMAIACCDNHLGKGFWDRTNTPERNYWRAQATAALTAIEGQPEVRVVPVMATEGMLIAAVDRPTAYAIGMGLYRSTYAAMLAAAPKLEDVP